MQPAIEKIVQDLAKKHKLPKAVVENAVKYPFDFLHSEIESHQFKTIMLHHLGKFTVKPGRLKQIQKWEDAKKTEKLDKPEDI